MEIIIFADIVRKSYDPPPPHLWKPPLAGTGQNIAAHVFGKHYQPICTWIEMIWS